MKTRNYSFYLLILLFTTLFITVSSAQKLQNSLLWRIEGNGIETSYLFGTFHMLSKTDFELKEKVSRAFSESEQLVMELKMDNPMIQMEMMKYMGMKDGMTLDKLLDSVDYRKLDAALKESMGVGILLFNTFKPMLVGTVLILNYIEGEPASFEMTLAAMAKEREMVVAGLETVEYQMRIFDEIPYEDQAVDLMEMVKEKEKMAKLFSEMVSLYKKEDINALFALTMEDAGSEKEIEMLLLKRNREWISKIGEFSKQNATFYAVGAAHLGGNEGCVMLLKKAGYKVTPVF